MDIRTLETLIFVVQHESLTEAAHVMGVTPAAVAQRIGVLEKQLGMKLVSRAGRSIRPTLEGAKVAERSRRIVADAKNLSSLDVSGEPIGQIRIGAVSTALTGILPRVLRELTDVAPQLGVFLSPGASPQLYGQVMTGDLDVAIIVKPPFQIQKTCDWVPVREDKMVLVTPAALRVFDPLEALENNPFIRCDRASWGGRLSDKYLREMRVRPVDRYELDSLEAIAVMVSEGLGISILPDWMPPWPAALNVKKLDLPGAPVREVICLWQRSTERMSAIDALMLALRRSQRHRLS